VDESKDDKDDEPNAWPEWGDPQTPESLPHRVHMGEPLELYVPVRLLLTEVEKSLQGLERGAATLNLGPDRLRELDHARRQRLEMLTWLRKRPEKSSVFVAMYPASEFDTPEPRGEDLPRTDGE
jgi:hypothetical protein